jgi:phosphonate transport system substrate-binding protein
VLFSNCERQVQSPFDGFIDVAWNTPLAHVRVRERTGGRSVSLGMRDSDRDFRSRIVVRRDAGIRGLKDLEGRTLAVGELIDFTHEQAATLSDLHTPNFM